MRVDTNTGLPLDAIPEKVDGAQEENSRAWRLLPALEAGSYLAVVSWLLPSNCRMRLDMRLL